MSATAGDVGQQIIKNSYKGCRGQLQAESLPGNNLFRLRLGPVAMRFAAVNQGKLPHTQGLLQNASCQRFCFSPASRRNGAKAPKLMNRSFSQWNGWTSGRAKSTNSTTR